MAYSCCLDSLLNIVVTKDSMQKWVTASQKNHCRSSAPFPMMESIVLVAAPVVLLVAVWAVEEVEVAVAAGRALGGGRLKVPMWENTRSRHSYQG